MFPLLDCTKGTLLRAKGIFLDSGGYGRCEKLAGNKIFLGLDVSSLMAIVRFRKGLGCKSLMDIDPRSIIRTLYV